MVTLKNKDDKELKKKFNKAQLKPFSRNLDVINECQELSGGENNEGVNEVIQIADKAIWSGQWANKACSGTD